MIIWRRCMAGDHRDCADDECTVADRWHAEVRRAGSAAGAPYAVVSTVRNRVEVVGTADTPERARELRIAYALDDAEYMTMVYVVRGSDGALS